MLSYAKSGFQKMMAAIFFSLLFTLALAVPSASAYGGVSVSIERVPGISEDSRGAVRLGTVHIAEDRDMPEVMLDGDFLELILPEGVIWSDQTAVSLECGATGETLVYTEGEEYSFSGERILSISLQGVTSGRDILTVEPFAQLDGFSEGKLYISIQGDLLGPDADDSVAAANAINYGATVECSSVVEASSDEPFTPGAVILHETCEGSFQQEEELKITLPEGFMLAEEGTFLSVKVLSGSNIFDDPIRKSDTVAALPVNRLSGSPVRVQMVLHNITAPEEFSGPVQIWVEGEKFSESLTIAHLEAPAEKPEESDPLPSDGADPVGSTLEANGKIRHTGGIFWIGSSTGIINGSSVKMGLSPYTKDGRAYLPVRYVAYALGITEEHILWDEALQLITLQKDDSIVQMSIGSPLLVADGIVHEMDVVPEITRGSTMLPARWVVEAFGGEIEWISEPPMMTIYTYTEK